MTHSRSSLVTTFSPRSSGYSFPTSFMDFVRVCWKYEIWDCKIHFLFFSLKNGYIVHKYLRRIHVSRKRVLHRSYKILNPQYIFQHYCGLPQYPLVYYPSLAFETLGELLWAQFPSSHYELQLWCIQGSIKNQSHLGLAFIKNANHSVERQMLRETEIVTFGLRII